MATAKENLEDFITCSVCLEKFEGRDPRLLPCGHAFCLTCIQDIFRTARTNQGNKPKDDEFRCPQCTSISTIPGNFVHNFPKFFYATHIHDAIQGNNPRNCHYDKEEVSGYCFTCTKAFCEQCLKVHNKNIRYENHVHVEVTKDNIKALVCTVHDEMVEAFCTDCCKAVCAQCQMAGHEDHKFSDFVIRAKPLRSQMREISQKQDVCKNEMQKLETMQQEFNSGIRNIHDKIAKQAEHLIAQISEQCKKLQAELSMYQADTNREIMKMKSNIQECDDMITQAQAQLAQPTPPIPELPSVCATNIDQLLLDIEQQFSLKPQVKDVLMVQFISQTDEVMLGTLSTFKESLHESQFSAIHNTPAMDEHIDPFPCPSWTSVAPATPSPTPAVGSVPTPGPSETMSLADSHTQPQGVTQPQLFTQQQLVTQQRLSTSLKESLQNMHLLPKQKMSVTDKNMHSIPGPSHGLSGPSVGASTRSPTPTTGYDLRQGTAETELVAKTLTQPRLVTQPKLVRKIISNDNVLDLAWTSSGVLLAAVTDDKLVRYTMRGKRLSAPCNVSGIRGLVRSVAVCQPQSAVAIVASSMPQDSNLFMLSMGIAGVAHYVKLVVRGRQLRHVCSLPKYIVAATLSAEGDVLMCGGKKLLKYNTEGTKLWEKDTTHDVDYITTKPDNKIIVCGDKQLSVHDQHGHWLSPFPRDTATLRVPQGVCVDSSGHVFVADSEKRAVLMYTSDGTYVREVVRVDGQPGPLALYQDRYLAVGQLDNKRYIHINDIQ